MATGVTDRRWSVGDWASLWEAYERGGQKEQRN
jgi:hypothetical protein